MSEDTGLYQHPEQILDRDDKAFLFFSWTQAGLVLGGLVVGMAASSWFHVTGWPFFGITVGGVLFGAILGFLRVEHVPLHEVIVVLLRYWAKRIRQGHPPVLHSADLWPTAPSREWGALFWEGTAGPVVQIGEEPRDQG